MQAVNSGWLFVLAIIAVGYFVLFHGHKDNGYVHLKPFTGYAFSQ